MLSFLWRQGRNLVVSAAQLEGSDGLEIFELEEELVGVGGLGPLEKRRADGYAVELCTCLLNVSEGNDGRGLGL